ncbi:MAG: phosphoribosylformylglycinamidine synthase subunit PurL [Candidatus Sumerlaeaceae bacterium]|nr:phosphoribosylformylglycinamidine synthase subunit PurL [Candidatus Sumerlaeaceae bacterium]
MGKVVITPEIIAEHGITPEEYQTILKILGREPRIVELGIFSVMWSEHCSYKNSKPLLRTFPTEGPHILQGPGENAGIVDFDERLAIVFKMESHNHPSALEPYQGAATGVGGILRDIFTMGARPVALLDLLRFGDPANPRTRRLVSGVIEGIADYGNAVGVPTVGGECYFSPAYDGNPLVNVMCVGVIEKDRITRAVGSGAGNLVVYYGNATGRDGIHGATFASTELTEESEDKRSAVQVGDPFMEKKILEVTLELIESNAVVALQDMGAAGLTCSTAEMAGRGGMGIRVDLDKVPQRAANLSAYEIMLSESQERMLAICEPAKLEQVRGILNKWDLDAHVLGELDASGLMKVYHRGELVAELPADKVSENSPVYEREARRPEYMDSIPDAANANLGPATDLKRELLEFLASPNICSKRWIYEQYDHMVQTQTLTPPGDNAGVLKIDGSRHSLAMAADGNGLYSYLDPFEGGKLAVAEAARNVACSGARPLAVTNCLNFGSPLKPEIFYQLSEAVRGIGAACKALNTPVTGGNVSLYNENPEGAIWPTPIIGIVGRLDRDVKPVKAGFPAAGLDVALIGPPARDLGGSEYVRWRTGKVHGPCPACDLDHERRVIEVLVAAANAGWLASAQDCGVGGLGVAVVESLLLGKPGLGLELDLGYVARGNEALRVEMFAETPGRVLISAAPDHYRQIQELCSKHGLPIALIGQTIQKSDQAAEAAHVGPELHGMQEPLLGNHDAELGIRHAPSGLRVRIGHLRNAYESRVSIFPPEKPVALYEA